MVKFGYSNIKTIPKVPCPSGAPWLTLDITLQEVPDHLRFAAFTLPKHMNGFLVKLLDVKKKALCRWLPCPLVRPDIR